MKPEDLLKNIQTPEPPAELRQRVLAAAMENATRADAPASWLMRFSKSRGVRYAWSTTLAACLLFLFFWNPPLPGAQASASQSTVLPEEKELAETMDPRLSAQARKAELLNALNGGDL